MCVRCQAAEEKLMKELEEKDEEECNRIFGVASDGTHGMLMCS